VYLRDVHRDNFTFSLTSVVEITAWIEVKHEEAAGLMVVLEMVQVLLAMSPTACLEKDVRNVS
jgi:hypothetical protein